jgi:hypothetical protein
VTLRTRLACAAGLAVALAVIAVALAVFLGVRGELRGEVDDSLRMRAEAILGGPGGGGPGPPNGFPPEGPPAAFGGPEGFVQVVLPGGRVLRRPNETGQLPVQERAREIAEAGEGEYLDDLTTEGVHVRVLTTALPRGQGAL